MITKNIHIAKKIRYVRNFGHESSVHPENIIDIGINAKNSELHAAMGLCMLPKFRKIIRKRKIPCEKYKMLLSNSHLTMPGTIAGATSNYGYFPVIFNSEKQLLSVLTFLNKRDIYPRRYFYPSLNTLKYVKYYPCPISEDISTRILCLPLYYDLNIQDVKIISNLIQEKL